MRYKVHEVIFSKPVPALGSGAWYEVASGKYAAADYDTDTGFLTLYPNEASPTLKKRRIPRENIADMVWGPTLSSAAAK